MSEVYDIAIIGAGIAGASLAAELGDAARVILDCAKERNADLIVMGTRGMSDLRGLLVGSVSHKVSHLADCSCVTVR